MRRIVLAALAVMISAGLVFSADQPKPAKKLLVKNPPAGATKRKIVYKVKENASTNTVVGDPVTDGATLRIVLSPGGDQCFTMPSSGWSTISSLGFKYKDPTLANGAVKVASIKKTPSDVFLIKAVIQGNGSEAITVEPGNPTDSYATNFTLGAGDSYCSGSGSATPQPNDDKTFKIVNDSAPVACGVAACSPSGAFLD